MRLDFVAICNLVANACARVFVRSLAIPQLCDAKVYAMVEL